MNTYITKADVDEILGADWAGTGDADRAVLQANAWLSAKGVTLNDPVDADVKMAGAYLAKESLSGKLYADDKGAIKSKKVGAGSARVETEYQDNARARSGSLSFINDLIRPFLPSGGGSTFIVSRG